MVLYVLEVAVYILCLAFIVTQLVIPGVRETAFFPLFRREGKLEQARVKTEQLLREQQLSKEIQDKLNKVSESK